MAANPFERVVRRDRVIVTAALVLIATLAWVHLFHLAHHMNMAGPDGAADASLAGRMQPGLSSWSTADALFMFMMWAVMMVAMMTPSVTPMILVHTRVARQALAKGKPFAATSWFGAGYLVAWTGFAVTATAAQWALERAALLTPAMAASSHVFGGMVLIVAGLYQWMPVKDACLAQCQSPLLFLQRHGGFRADIRGSLSLGARHGLYCIGCCWALMLLLFVGGVMNIVWIAAIAALVLLEKVLPRGRMLVRGIGAALIFAGVWLAGGYG